MKKRRKDWYLGFFGLFAFYALPGLMEGEWMQAAWLVWAVWFIYFLPPKNQEKESGEAEEK